MADFNFLSYKYDSLSITGIDFDFRVDGNKILGGNSNVFMSISTDPNASRNSGLMYVTSYGHSAAFFVLDLNTKKLYDKYTINKKGRAGEMLKKEDMKDLIV